MTTPILDIRDIRKQYGRAPALDGVSLHVHEGEIFGLLGPNGAGKTTLLSILSGLLEATTGEVRLRGEIFSQKSRNLRPLLGIAPQELALYGELSARENLRFFGSLYRLHGVPLETRIDDVLHSIGLEDRADQRVATYSGGMKRRLNLGAALVHQPAILLLDEPTTGVDPQSRNYIFEEVRRLNRQGLTVVYTSHYMEEVQALCTRVGIIDHGKVIACDQLSHLLGRFPGLIRLRGDVSETVRARLRRLEGVVLLEREGRPVELECRDPQRVLPQLIALLSEAKIELAGLEIEGPNLERVFLHLTGRALRD